MLCYYDNKGIINALKICIKPRSDHIKSLVLSYLYLIFPIKLGFYYGLTWDNLRQFFGITWIFLWDNLRWFFSSFHFLKIISDNSQISWRRKAGCTLLQKQPQEMFYKKEVIKDLTKFTEKHLCRGLFFNKAAGLMSSTLFKKRLQHRYFSVNFRNLIRT